MITVSRPWIGTDERHIRDTLTPVLAAVCAEAGLDHTGATLLRYVNNAVFRLERHRVVVRIGTVPAMRYRAYNAATAARWFAEHDVPAVRLWPGVEQPVVVDGHVATLWHEVPVVGPPPAGRDLAALLREVHALPDPPLPLTAWQPIADARRRLDDALGLAPEDRLFLEARYAELEAALAELRFVLPPGVIHGDAHRGNLIPGPDGPVLCDLDMACIGPREWDLTPLAVGRLRFGYPAQEYEDLVAAYGYDVTRWPGFWVLRELRELKTTTGALSVMHSNPGLRNEFAHRVRTLRDGQRDARWAPYQ